MLKKICYLYIIIIAFSCKEIQKEERSISNGKIKIAVDESLKPIMTAQITAYRVRYPYANIIPVFTSEQRAVDLLMKDSADVAAVSREFTANEQKFIKSKGIEYQPARMALDAVALITNKNNGDTTISLTEIKNLMTNPSSQIKLVFDKSNSSNFDLLLNKFGLKTVANDKIFAAESNEKVFEFIQKNNNAIGIVGYNWISDVDDPKANTLKNSVSVLAVSDKAGYYKPTLKNIKDRNYPLERFVILHTLYHVWGIEDGFIRFACSKVGQLVTEKMGLVPFYKIPRAMILNKEKMPVK